MHIEDQNNKWFAAAEMVLVTALLALCVGGLRSVFDSQPQDPVERLLQQMTLAEKIRLIHGASEDPSTSQGQAGYMPGIARLRIPALRLADGPPGVLTREVSTGMTATMGLAATFSRDDALANGQVIGRDARALGIDVVLEPYLNLNRDPTFRRAYNTYGEDPLLAGAIGARLIEGIQAQGVMAQAKHLIGYEGPDHVGMDEQTLREIYLRPFADAAAAGVSSMMCSYNKLNGVYACDSDYVQNRILRQELGFKGFVTSDWGGNHGAEFINNGLDLEMPGETGGFAPSFFTASLDVKERASAPLGGGNADTARIPEEQAPPSSAPVAGRPRERLQAGKSASLGIAMQQGAVKEAAVTQAARRILQQMQRFGFLDREPKHAVTEQDVQGDAAVVQRTAEHAAVLLKNEAQVLPLTREDLTSLALIGPGAAQTVAIGEASEKALGRVARQLGALQALQQYAAQVEGANIRYAEGLSMHGVPVPSDALSHAGEPGLLRTQAKTQTAQVDAQIDFTLSNQAALPAGSSFEWQGALQAPAAGAYDLNLHVLGGQGSLSVDGKLLASGASLRMQGDVLQAGQSNVLPTPDGLDTMRRRVELSAGAHEIKLAVKGDRSGKPVQLRLNWVTPEQRRADYAAALAAAKAAKKVVVFAWSRGRPEPFMLPGDQNKLIADVAALNPNTIVVLNTSQAVALPWLDRVRGLVEMWYTGDEGGAAAANILLGKANPAGRLPFTWPRSLEQLPANDPQYPERSTADSDGVTRYSEGLLLGYRWFDAKRMTPQFPFGYGLSYTQFEYSDLQTQRSADGGLDVSFVLRNAGSAAGDEVPQIYLGAPDAGGTAQFAPRSLLAFDRQSLQAGERKRVALHVPLHDLQYWSTDQQAWRLAPGKRVLYVGASSRDLRLQTDLVLDSKS